MISTSVYDKSPDSRNLTTAAVHRSLGTLLRTWSSLSSINKAPARPPVCVIMATLDRESLSLAIAAHTEFLTLTLGYDEVLWRRGALCRYTIVTSWGAVSSYDCDVMRRCAATCILWRRAVLSDVTHCGVATSRGTMTSFLYSLAHNEPSLQWKLFCNKPSLGRNFTYIRSKETSEIGYNWPFLQSPTAFVVSVVDYCRGTMAA